VKAIPEQKIEEEDEPSYFVSGLEDHESIVLKMPEDGLGVPKKDASRKSTAKPKKLN